LTRLKTSDISHISSRLEAYNLDLLAKTGRTLLGIACHACDLDEKIIQRQIRSFSIHVIPITAGQGSIPEFSATVCAILRFIGFKAQISDQPDTSGIANSFESKADAIMMADDHRFVGINLGKGSVADNSEATGRVFASVLDLMAKGIKDRRVLILGCGPVGEAAARKLLSFGAQVGVYDSHFSSAQLLKEKFSVYPTANKIVIEENINIALSNYEYILEATPSADTIPDKLICDRMVVAAPGVPLGISANGCKLLKDRLVQDKLELGVAAMAISLLL
jgi:pyrrolysine biosynthesis protein PylD